MRIWSMIRISENNLVLGKRRGKYYWANLHLTFILLDINFRFTCGESNLPRKTVNCQNVFSTIADDKKLVRIRMATVCKENANVFLDFLLSSFNAAKVKSELPSIPQFKIKTAAFKRAAVIKNWKTLYQEKIAFNS